VEFARLLALLTALGIGGAIGAVIKGLFDRSQAKLSGEQTAEVQASQRVHQVKVQEIDLQGQALRQASEHRHQQGMLAQQAHFEVRKEMAELVRGVVLWRENELMARFGHEAGMFLEYTPDGAHADPGVVLGALLTIATTHPTKAVRNAASELSTRVSLVFNSYSTRSGKMHQPGADDLLAWGALVMQLVELINEPPSAD
jgi:hypothetical protein